MLFNYFIKSEILTNWLQITPENYDEQLNLTVY